MNTAIQHQGSVYAKKEKAVTAKVKTNSLSAFWEKAEFNRFGIISFTLVIIAIMGGFAAAAGIEKSVLHLAIVAFSTALVEATVVAVMPMRIIIISAIIALALSIGVIIF